MRHTMMIAGLASSLLLALPATAQDDPTDRVAAGYEKSFRCYACHGREGVSDNPTVPSLAGQKARYMEEQLKHFKEGQRYSPRMTPVAQSLSRTDMEQLAAYFSRLPAMREVSDETY